ncbi:hypothetical protein OMP38_06385 [Cohnella ginsengisoli]|uniref:Uncharacterized protein n=1 Tax=Cohnella ginsengisoli TaxID=425004 RepID=A0A9X4KEW6_9BACL|nr:hypothetical protein [Cohnella ginsengisoli]MDG0790516.1 hypothetical protein [Cohnella ginsengisoli]
MPNNKQNGTTRKGANVQANKVPASSQSDTEFASEQSPGTGSVTKLPSRKG